VELAFLVWLGSIASFAIGPHGLLVWRRARQQRLEMSGR